jgi:hypothetical protein
MNEFTLEMNPAPFIHKDVDENKHERQCTYNAILRRISVAIFAMEKQ